MEARPVRVLLVEDDVIHANLVVSRLEKESETCFDIVCHASLEDALNTLDEFSFDVILLDLCLSDSDGFDTFSRIYAQSPHIPIIVLTSEHQDKELAFKTIHEGAQDYLFKLETTRELLVRSIYYAIERNKQRETIKNLQKDIRIIFDAVPAMIFYKDRENRFIRVNRTCADSIGLSKQEIEGKTVFELFNDPELAEAYWKDDLEVITSNRPKRNIIQKFIADRTKWIRTDKIPYTNENREVIGIIGFAVDITEVRAAEEAMTLAKIAAEDSSRAKSEFLANMSHEIRTPISGIIGIAEMMLNQESREDQRKSLQMIRDSAGSLLMIINDILDFSKIEAEKLELRLEHFDLSNVMERILSTFIVQTREKGLTFHFHQPQDVPKYLYGDPYRLEQILNNLVGNALKFTDKGDISVEVKKLKQEASGITLEFSVTDTGIGIPKDKRDKLFQNFSQIDSSYSKKYGGTGLGLVISKKLTEMMGGKIWVKTQNGAGSTFFFTAQFQESKGHEDDLNRQKSRPAYESLKVGSSLRLEPTTPLSILLAEDSDVNQKFISYFLRLEGHTVFSVSNGKEVLSALKRMRFDLILMDVQMPEMDGIETTQKVRNGEADGFNINIPIIALTAYAMKGDREKFLKAGMDDYIAKPIDISELRAIIDRVVSQQNDYPNYSKENFPRSENLKLLNKEAALERFCGNSQLLDQCYEIFMQGINKQKEILKKALADLNLGLITLEAHKLKGASGHMGAESCHIYASRLENAARQKDMEQVRAFYPLLEKELTKLQSALTNNTPPQQKP